MHIISIIFTHLSIHRLSIPIISLSYLPALFYKCFIAMCLSRQIKV